VTTVSWTFHYTEESEQQDVTGLVFFVTYQQGKLQESRIK